MYMYLPIRLMEPYSYEKKLASKGRYHYTNIIYYFHPIRFQYCDYYLYQLQQIYEKKSSISNNDNEGSEKKINTMLLSLAPYLNDL